MFSLRSPIVLNMFIMLCFRMITLTNNHRIFIFIILFRRFYFTRIQWQVSTYFTFQHRIFELKFENYFSAKETSVQCESWLLHKVLVVVVVNCVCFPSRDKGNSSSNERICDVQWSISERCCCYCIVLFHYAEKKRTGTIFFWIQVRCLAIMYEEFVVAKGRFLFIFEIMPRGNESKRLF